MTVPPSSRSRAGFTLIELLLAIALGVLVAAILAALVHSLLSAGDVLSARTRGPFAARAAVRELAREIACAFPPPGPDSVPLQLAASTDPDQPQVRLAFFVPVPAEPRGAGGYDLQQVVWSVQPFPDGRRELRRVSAPCSGPRTNAWTTNVWLQGNFSLAVEAVTNGTGLAEWPPPRTADSPGLPPSLRLALALPGAEPIRTEVLIQTANGIRSPVARQNPAPGGAPP